MMRTSYDPLADAMYVNVGPETATVHDTREVAPGVFMDLDQAGQLVGVEILGVTPRASGTYGAHPVLSAAE